MKDDLEYAYKVYITLSRENKICMHFMCAHLYWSVWKKIRKCWTVLFKTLLIRRNIDLLRPRTQGHQSREDKKSPFILSCTNTFIYIVFATHSVL